MRRNSKGQFVADEPVVAPTGPNLHEEHVALLESIRDENTIYAASGDPMLSRSGRLFGTIATVMLSFLNTIDERDYSALAVEFSPEGSDPKRPNS